MAAMDVVKSVCGLCSGNCGLLITMDNGKPVSVKGDPDNPVNQGRLCPVGRASLEYFYSPERLKHPLKRTRSGGKDRWQEISWDEAFGLAADGLARIRKESGPESVAIIHGSAKGLIDTVAVRFANAFGTPNVVTSDHVCHVPRMLAAEYTFGFFPGAEYGHPPACIIVWGVNKIETRFYQHRAIMEARKKGSKLITIDPLHIPHAKAADLWLQVRPGTDLPLALGMINVIINEGLYDRDFVEKWTIGFEKLKAHVQAYPPETAAEITWVPADAIRRAARMYATNRPGRIEWGNGLDGTLNSFQAGRALSILMALTGNLDVPGGEIEGAGSGFRYVDKFPGNRTHGRWSDQLELRDRLSPDQRKKKIAPDLIPDFRYVTPQSFATSVLEGKPYRIRAAFVQASNPLSAWSNIKRTRQAFEGLDFLVVSDMFMTPTAALAHIVFPAASFLEFDGIQSVPGVPTPQEQRKVGQVGECLPTVEIVNGLARRLGLEADFWPNLEAFWDYVLEPTGVTYQELKSSPPAGKVAPRQYRKYEQRGFKTPSGKVDLYSSQLEAWGFDPMPVYRTSPEMPPSGNRPPAQDYPFCCTTRKLAAFRHSGGRQIPSLRKSHPEPLVLIHPDAARKLDIKEGDWVYIESRTGRIRQKASLSTGVDPRVVVADYAWWFPEKGADQFFGWSESNYNILTSDEPPFNPEVGSFTIRGLQCKVTKVT
jgi:anaerobic selenocysteine-containing dehydrogenase